jgi:hypothetical protein
MMHDHDDQPKPPDPTGRVCLYNLVTTGMPLPSRNLPQPTSDLHWLYSTVVETICET